MKTDSKRFDAGVFLLIVAIAVFQFVRLGDCPGLNLDAINPDYIGVQLLYPQRYETKWQAAWPWLCQIYHGNVGVLITLLVTAVTGSVGVLQYHITYGVVAAVAVFLAYLVLTHRRVGLPKAWAAFGSIVLVTWPSLFTIIIMPYYMCLFGTACVLGGTLLFLDWMDKPRRLKKAILCYLLFGLAFYSYFNFAFFLPPLLLFTLCVLKKDGAVRFDAVVTLLIAYGIGCGLYVVGWTQIALRAGGTNMTPGRKAELFFAVYALILGLYIAFRKRFRFRLFLAGICAVGGVAWLVAVFPSIRTIASSLEVVNDATVAERALRVLSDYSSILSGRYAERKIYVEPVTIWNTYAPYAAVGTAAAALVFDRIRKKRFAGWNVPVCTGALFLCGCAVFGTRMQPQHYVPLLFLTYISICMCVQSLFAPAQGPVGTRAARRKRAAARRGGKAALGVALGVALFFNLFNNARILQTLRETGGEGAWASEMTELAYEAAENRRQGQKELYVFSDWGFFTGFSYLTMNAVPFVTVIRQDQLARFYGEGGSIVACYWSADDTETYERLLESVSDGSGSVTSRAWIDKNGKTEFYEMTLSHAEG